jgi:hypothetical protein
MNDTFIITVLSFALVLAVVASLFVWVILPALEEEGVVQGNNSIQELQDDVEEKVNSINRKAYQYDLDQQAVIDKNKADILQLKTRLDTHVAATGPGTHVPATQTTSGVTTVTNAASPVQLRSNGVSSMTSPNGLNSTTGVSAANQATVSFTDGTWTIHQGDVSYKANQTHICGSPGNCISRTT